jgi:hypothetical protein
MKRQFVFGTVMAAALTVGLGAQTPSPQDYPQSSKPQSSSSSQEKRGSDTARGQMVTVTGCFQSADTSATAATGTAGTTAKSSGASSAAFKLTDVAQSSTDKSGAAGTAGTAGMASIPTTLDLMASGSSSANWSKYLNHKVEVKGTLENAGGAGSSAASPSSTSPSTTPPSTNPPSSTANPAGTPSSTMSSAGAGATLHVTSIKEVSASCSGSSIPK